MPARSLGSRACSFSTCSSLLDYAGPDGNSRYRSHPCCLPVGSTRSAPELRFSKLNSRPVDAFVYASPGASRHPAQDSRSRWFAIPFLWGSFIPDYTPVYPDDCAPSNVTSRAAHIVALGQHRRHHLQRRPRHPDERISLTARGGRRFREGRTTHANAGNGNALNRPHPTPLGGLRRLILGYASASQMRISGAYVCEECSDDAIAMPGTELEKHFVRCYHEGATKARIQSRD
jgi:hypothetical protein